MSKLITIKKDYLDRLKRKEAFLQALQDAGVDNWEGYSEAIKIFHEDHPEYDDE